MFEQLHREFSVRGLAVVGINAREGTSTIRDYANELGLTFMLMLDPKGIVNTAYGVIGLPTTFLIGRDGRPVALVIGPRDWNGKAARALIDALLAGRVASSERTPIAELAVKSRLPAIYDRSEFVEAGGLLSYATSIADLDRRAATYVDKILKGAKPADLPVEQPKKFDFIINLKAAKQIGLTIPPNVLARADRVIR